MPKPITNKSNTHSTLNPSTPVDTHSADAEAVGSATAVELHRAAAMALAPDSVLVCNADPRLGYHNAMAGRDAVFARRADIDATGFRADWARIDSLGSLVSAVICAAGRVEANPQETGTVRVLLNEARPLRALLLAHARAQSLSNRCPAAEVARIAKGRGSVDTAQDLVDLADLYDAHSLVGAGVEAGQAERARALGDLLLKRIRPAGQASHHKRTTQQQQAAALRDRLWTLVVHTHQHLEQAAGSLWGSRVRGHLPALRSRRSSRRRRPKLTVPPG